MLHSLQRNGEVASNIFDLPKSMAHRVDNIAQRVVCDCGRCYNASMFPMNGTVFELGSRRLAASAVRLSNWVGSPRTIWGGALLPPGVRLAQRLAEALLRRRCIIRAAGH